MTLNKHWTVGDTQLQRAFFIAFGIESRRNRFGIIRKFLLVQHKQKILSMFQAKGGRETTIYLTY